MSATEMVEMSAVENANFSKTTDGVDAPPEDDTSAGSQSGSPKCTASSPIQRSEEVAADNEASPGSQAGSPKPSSPSSVRQSGEVPAYNQTSPDSQAGSPRSSLPSSVRQSGEVSNHQASPGSQAGSPKSISPARNPVEAGKPAVLAIDVSPVSQAQSPTTHAAPNSELQRRSGSSSGGPAAAAAAAAAAASSPKQSAPASPHGSGYVTPTARGTSAGGGGGGGHASGNVPPTANRTPDNPLGLPENPGEPTEEQKRAYIQLKKRIKYLRRTREALGFNRGVPTDSEYESDIEQGNMRRTLRTVQKLAEHDAITRELHLLSKVYNIYNNTWGKFRDNKRPVKYATPPHGGELNISSASEASQPSPSPAETVGTGESSGGGGGSKEDPQPETKQSPSKYKYGRVVKEAKGRSATSRKKKQLPREVKSVLGRAPSRRQMDLAAMLGALEPDSAFDWETLPPTDDEEEEGGGSGQGGEMKSSIYRPVDTADAAAAAFGAVSFETGDGPDTTNGLFLRRGSFAGAVARWMSGQAAGEDVSSEEEERDDEAVTLDKVLLHDIMCEEIERSPKSADGEASNLSLIHADEGVDLDVNGLSTSNSDSSVEERKDRARRNLGYTRPPKNRSDGASNDDEGGTELVFIGGRSFRRPKRTEPDKNTKAPEVLGSNRGEKAQSEADKWDTEHHADQHEATSVIVFALGWLIFPVWWGGCCLVSQDKGKPWEATKLARCLSIAAIVLGTLWMAGLVAAGLSLYFIGSIPPEHIPLLPLPP